MKFQCRSQHLVKHTPTHDEISPCLLIFQWRMQLQVDMGVFPMHSHRSNASCQASVWHHCHSPASPHQLAALAQGKGAGPGARLATGHAKCTASHRPRANPTNQGPFASRHTFHIAALSHLLYFLSPLSSPTTGQFRASPGFPGRWPPPAQELCSLLCHEQQPPNEVASLLPTRTWKNPHISIKRHCKHLKN